jgi:hypothetical protein
MALSRKKATTIALDPEADQRRRMALMMNQRLRAARDLLLPRLMSGQIAV